MKPNVEAAITQLREGLPGKNVQVAEDADGGAHVTVEGLEIGECFEPGVSWVGFHLTWSYPDAAVYPHFIDPVVRYVGSGPTPNQHPGGALPAALARGRYQVTGSERDAIQVSRQSNHWNPATDTALNKLLRVLEFLRSR